MRLRWWLRAMYIRAFCKICQQFYLARGSDLQVWPNQIRKHHLEGNAVLQDSWAYENNESPKFFRNRSKGSPMRGDTLLKSGNCSYFWAAFPLPALIEVKFCTAKRTHVPVGHAKFDVNRCKESALRDEKPYFWPVSKFNTDRKSVV